MDSLTQIVLGAAVGQAVMGRPLGRRALVWGAALGTLPDLDVLVPMGDAVMSFTRHRSWSHSLLLLSALAPLLAWFGRCLHPDTATERRRWLWMVLLVFWTHVILDCCTVYGTQIFWPLPWSPQSWSTIFVIDPLYTLPLLVGVSAVACGRPRANRWGLLLSSLYLVWSLGAKLMVEQRVASELEQQGIHDARLLTTPTAFNTLLWRIVVLHGDEYWEGFHSLAAPAERLEFRRFPQSTVTLPSPRMQPEALHRLDWFTDGFLSLSADGDTVIATDLRMGSEPWYAFRFAIATIRGRDWVGCEVTKLRAALPEDALPRLWQRIWDPDAELFPR